MTATASSERAGFREWCGLAVLALPLLVLAMDVSVLYLASVEISADLRPSATQQLWILDVYGFFIGGFLLTMGTVGDRIGRRRLLLIGGAAFAVASMIAAYAPTAEALIAARALLGIAGATLMPSTLGLISTMFRDPAQRSFAIAVWFTTFSAGVAVGPMIGGALLQHFWWGAAFLLAVPAMAALLVLGPVLLPEQRGTGGGRRVDLVSVALSLAAMLPLVYGIKEVVAHGVAVAPLAATAAGLGFGVGFVHRQRRLADPMLDVTLFSRRAFVGAISVMVLGILAVNALLFLLPQYLQLVRGIPVLEAGLWMVPVALLPVLGSLLTPRAAGRFGRSAVLATAAAGGALACLALTGVDAGSAMPVVVGLVAVAALGSTPLGVLGTELVVGSVPPGRAGSAAAVSETAGELAVALSVAVAGTVLAAVYRVHVDGALPAGLAPDAVGTVREGLAPATAVAGELPAPVGVQVLDVARAGFTEGFTAVGFVAAGMLACVVAVALAVLRER
ncbi:MFS transporter [Pseudonocardia sp. DSM 110487]|uniref:MFS transporter n=1 Tax=Pseudonocardia sp. DSM 110487 TaxID=2865833 RepID=UPI0021065FAC|nr:MFS transporter [Pseudonocardia sp. DSM 110487]